MRRKVYDYIVENPNSTYQMCAKALGIEELEALALIHELLNDGLLKLKVFPLGNIIDANCSSFYSVCKAYHD